jgi:hypothetical protein
MTRKELPSWIGKVSVPETRGCTMELLSVWSDWVGEPEPKIDSDTSISDDVFLAKISDLVNSQYVPKSESLRNPKRKGAGIWVGFPETLTGKVNSWLAGQLWHLEEDG